MKICLYTVCNPLYKREAMGKVGQEQGQRNGRIWIWENKRDDEMGRQIWTNTVG